MTSADIIAALRTKYDPDKGWAFFTELRARTGWDCRTIDAFALGTWKKQGFRSVAVEVKVSRADFANEIKDPSKRAPWEAVASECYFATPPGLVTPDEVPEGWGLFECTKTGKIRRKKIATQRKPDPWPPEFIAMIARRTSDVGTEGLIRQITPGLQREATDRAAKMFERQLADANQRAGVDAELAEIVRSTLGRYITPDKARDALRAARIDWDLATDELAHVRRAKRTADDLSAQLARILAMSGTEPRNPTMKEKLRR